MPFIQKLTKPEIIQPTISLSNSHTPNQNFPDLNHPRTRYQEIRNLSYRTKPGRINQISQFLTVYSVQFASPWKTSIKATVLRSPLSSAPSLPWYLPPQPSVARTDLLSLQSVSITNFFRASFSLPLTATIILPYHFQYVHS